MRTSYEDAWSWQRRIAVLWLFLLLVASLSAQVRQSRISQAMATRSSVALAGSVHPLATAGADFGAVDSSMQNVTGLNNFRVKSHLVSAVSPEYTADGTRLYMTPGDWKPSSVPPAQA